MAQPAASGAVHRQVAILGIVAAGDDLLGHDLGAIRLRESIIGDQLLSRISSNQLQATEPVALRQSVPLPLVARFDKAGEASLGSEALKIGTRLDVSGPWNRKAMLRGQSVLLFLGR